MIELARSTEHGADFEGGPVADPPEARIRGGPAESDASWCRPGHVLNYLDARADVAQALGELARAVRPGGLLAIDLMTERYRERPDLGGVHAKVTDDWVIVTRFSRPEPHGFDRAITVFRRDGD